jgi:nucleoside-diphosphate-sugar epimerase
VPLYALSKLGSEGVAERYASLYGIEVVSVRFSDVYGPMDRDTGCMLIAC